MHITILIPGFGLSSAIIGPYEVFSSAGVLWNTLCGEDIDASFEVILASEDGKPVSFEGGVTISPDRAVSQIKKTDLIFIPTIGLDLEMVFSKNKKMLNFLKHQANKGVRIAAVCTGVSMLAEAGLLNDRPATTHWALADQYHKRYPLVHWKSELFITESDNIFCGGGVYASLDLCLFLVERLAGYDIAKQAGQALLIDPPRTWQASFSAPLVHRQHHDEVVSRAQEYMHEYFNAQFTMDDLAHQMGMSTRNFNRRFKNATGETPLAYLHKLRINYAKTLLETNFKSIQEVCYNVGYEDIPFFRSIFKRYTGLTPKQYKQRFSGRRA
ncbi:MAG: helix-turn-helix domain-containing protein [Pseudomonadales bacterium]|nr:helix-turn-helix domain-containing protein [Pseudomonadales bacterium]